MRAYSLPILALLLLGAGCRSKPPADDRICWKGGGGQSPNPIDTECEPEMCFDEVLRDTLVGSYWLAPNWNFPEDRLSTDENPQSVQLVYAEGVAALAHFIDVRFDNRVTIEPSLEKFQQYVLGASGKYEPYYGEIEFNTQDVEVLSYAAGWLKVRIHANFNRIFYVGIDPINGLDFCSYSPTNSGSDPELGELDLIVEGPIDTTSPSP